jgi:hypothetical protein
VIDTEPVLVDDARSYDTALELLRQHDDLVTIYAAGGAGTASSAPCETASDGRPHLHDLQPIQRIHAAALAGNTVTAVTSTPLLQLSQVLMQLIRGLAAESVG